MGKLSVVELRRGTRRRVRKLARTIQSSLPWVREPKYRAQAGIRRLRGRPHERDFDLFGLLTIETDHVVVDIGANRGQSIESVRLHQPTVEVHAYEPQSVLADRLRADYADDELVHVHHRGLGAEPGELVLYTPVYRGYVYDGLASTVRSDAEDWLSDKTVYRFRPDRLELREERIEIATLDDDQHRAAVVKIDVQGAEQDVLVGGETTLRTHAPIVLLEAPTAELTEMLRGWGYAPHWWTGERLSATPSRAKNIFFLPADGAGTGWKLGADAITS